VDSRLHLALLVAATLVAPPGRVARAQDLPPGVQPVTAGPRADSVTLATPTGVLHGTLLMPARAATAVPVVLIHAGSGPTDRDGNSPLLSGANNSLRLLAEGLATLGIASVRFDKRGIAASRAAGGREEDLRFDILIDDAAAWVRQLRADPRFSTITVVGHSEGSLIGMVAARRADADAFVSIAGTGRPAQDVLREQLGQQLSPTMMAGAARGLDALAAGRFADSTPPALESLFRRSVQPYLISWFRYDPSKEIAALTTPVLIVQGTTDLQVPVSDARLLAAAAPRGRLLLVDGMNHVLKLASGDRNAQMRSYSDPSLPVAPLLTAAIVDLVRGLR
jgi:pimeloyl-ACP methyl ester carboxylesterase